eukprot:Em0001g541a
MHQVPHRKYSSIWRYVRRHCAECNRDIRSGDYEGHECVPSLTPEEEKQAAELLKRAISTSPDKGVVQLATGGAPMTFMQVTKAKQQTTSACSRTTKMRCSEMQRIRSIVSGGEASALIQKEVLTLSDEERQCLLATASISSSIEIGPAQVLAIKAGLAIPWNKLRLLRRWLKSSGIHLAGEERMRHISSHIVGDNLKGEVAPFTFPHPSGGDEIKGAPLVYIPHLVDKVIHFLNENERAGRLTWHEGFIPASEVWIKIVGDKGGGTFKMSFQIVNIDTPNAVHNTCVFSCFAADDSVTNFHVALDRFKEQIEHMHGMKWRQYTVKVFICGDYEFLSKMYGLSGASGCYPCLYCKIRRDQMATPLSIRGHATERSLEGMSADHQCYISSGSIKKDAQKFFNCISVPIFDIPIVQEAKVAKCIAAVERGYPEKEGPFVKILDNALQSFGVQRQQYFSGAFIGNHVHTALQWANTYHVGFGLLAESIHAKFNRLGLVFAPIRDRVENLLCIVKEHLLSIEPQLVAAIPPPAKRVKNI